jgi:hypothetical protein
LLKQKRTIQKTKTQKAEVVVAVEVSDTTEAQLILCSWLPKNLLNHCITIQLFLRS